VTIELKNDLCITGTLKSVDQFLNIKLDEIRVKDENKYPHLVYGTSTSLLKRRTAADIDRRR
jgi:small nuclear ribonucleoprotein (snRNP)-like protein